MVLVGVTIQTTRPFTYPTKVVEVEIGGQLSVQLSHKNAKTA